MDAGLNNSGRYPINSETVDISHRVVFLYIKRNHYRSASSKKLFKSISQCDWKITKFKWITNQKWVEINISPILIFQQFYFRFSFWYWEFFLAIGWSTRIAKCFQRNRKFFVIENVTNYFPNTFIFETILRNTTQCICMFA